MANSSLQLVLNIHYINDGVSEDTLLDMLADVVGHAMGDGTICCDTEAVVDEYASSAHKLFEGKKEHKDFTRTSWRNAVWSGETSLGYSEWVSKREEAEQSK